MFVAAPESSCGAVACTGDLALGFGDCFGCAALPTVADRSVSSTPASSKRLAWVSFACGTYSVAGVSSKELAKSEPMLLAFSEELAIH